MTQQRELFASRLGFILMTAGCAIGLGNVWRFPYIVGQYGGGLFVLLYLFFLAVLGFPVLLMELSLGRAGQDAAPIPALSGICRTRIPVTAGPDLPMCCLQGT